MAFQLSLPQYSFGENFLLPSSKCKSAACFFYFNRFRNVDSFYQLCKFLDTLGHLGNVLGFEKVLRFKAVPHSIPWLKKESKLDWLEGAPSSLRVQHWSSIQHVAVLLGSTKNKWLSNQAFICDECIHIMMCFQLMEPNPTCCSQSLE